MLCDGSAMSQFSVSCSQQSQVTDNSRRAARRVSCEFQKKSSPLDKLSMCGLVVSRLVVSSNIYAYIVAILALPCK